MKLLDAMGHQTNDLFGGKAQMDGLRQEVVQQLDEPVPPDSAGWTGKWGLICFGASWLWSLVTSLSLLRQVKSDEQAGQRPVPPRLADLAGKPPE